MKGNKQTKQYIITFTYEDNESSKYIVNRYNYYQAKEEAEDIMSENNKNIDNVYITRYDVKDG
jgi:hypothetical protein